MTVTETQIPAWECDECDSVFTTQAAAERCCRVRLCDECEQPLSKEDRRGYLTIHEKCWRGAHDRKYAKVLSDAELVTEWSEPVWTSPQLGLRDGYFYSPDELAEAIVDLGHEENCFLEIPDRVHLTTTEHIVDRLNLGDIFEHLSEDTYDDFEPTWVGEGKLEAAITEFKELNQDHVQYSNDYKRAILLKDYLGKKLHAELVATVEEARRVKAAEKS